jgi:hypothetical protein
MREAAEGTFETVLSVAGPATLDVAVDYGLIRVRAGDPGSVRIRGILRARRWFFGWVSVENRIRQLESKPPVEQSGTTIQVGAVAGRWLFRGIALYLEITVPADTRIRALADSGDIRVEGIAGAVDCETDSGDVELSAIHGNVRASADSGSIRIREVAGRVNAEADSGDIEALEIAGEIEAATDSGDIRISQTVAAPVRAEADSGGIRVQLAPGAGYNVSAETDHGRITVPEMEWRTRSKQEVDGRIGGGGPLVDLETDSGDIDIA